MEYSGPENVARRYGGVVQDPKLSTIVVDLRRNDVLLGRGTGPNGTVLFFFVSFLPIVMLCLRA